MSPPPTVDPCISYGRGGAGNMRRRSSTLDAWSKISSSSAQQPPLVSSPDDHYASSKSEPRMSTSSGRRRSSLWSTSTATAERRPVWKRLFGRRRSRGEGEGQNEAGGKIEDSEE